MKIVSNAVDSLHEAYISENLPKPAVLSWPLTGNAEKDRLIRQDAFRQGLGADPPPGLAWISAHADAKYNPEKVLPGARTVLLSFLPYFREDDEESAGAGQDGESFGRVARYARGRDYHKELGGRLRRIAKTLSTAYPSHQFRAFTDIGPLDETWLAEASGMGFKGRHTLAILPGSGSWVVLGHIVTTLAVEAASVRPSPISCPEGCRRCIDACPTAALSLPGTLNASSCISYRSIEHSGPDDPSLREATGDMLFGCDICQEACPYNARVQPTDVTAFLKNIAGASLSLAEILRLESHEELTFRLAGSPLMRAGRNGLVRNACTAAGNSGDRSLLPILEALLDDEDDGVREHASWAVGRLS